MIRKEARQLRRDRRTLAMMLVLPVVLLVVFGYAARFDVAGIPVRVVGPQAEAVAPALPEPFEVDGVDPSGTRSDAVDALRRGDVAAAVVTADGRPTVLLDGTQLFVVNTARAALAREAATAPTEVDVDVLFNPDLATSTVMVPGLAGLILLFVGTVITSLGVVRERQAGTLEQLAVMPLRPRDVFVGKVAPYFLVAAVDMVVVLGVGMAVFDVPFRGPVPVLALGTVLFLFVTLGLGVLISTVSENQGQAIQLALMILLPQVLLSGLIFPVDSMAPGVRWIARLLPLTWFNEIARGVMLRDAPLGSLALPLAVLAVMGVAVMGLATLRFRRDLAPSPRHRPAGDPSDPGVRAVGAAA